MTPFRLRDFVQMASSLLTNWLNHHSGHSWLWLLLSHIILCQTCSKLQNKSIEDSEVDIDRLEKVDFADLVKDCQVTCRFFVQVFCPNFHLDVMMSHIKHGLATHRTVSLMVISGSASFETNFCRIAGTSEAEILVSS